MAQPMQGETNFDFPGITVRIPDQGRWVKVIEKPLPDLKSLPADENFTPIRLITNLAVVDYDNPEIILTDFDPPVEIYARYIVQDIFESARRQRSLKLAYLDADKQVWVVFTPEFHGYRLLPPSVNLVGRAQFNSWAGDPVIGWGG
jgi:hypothetical protein